MLIIAPIICLLAPGEKDNPPAEFFKLSPVEIFTLPEVVAIDDPELIKMSDENCESLEDPMLAKVLKDK